MNDQNTIQEQVRDSQKLFFAILNVVYESIYPITLETISFQMDHLPTSKLAEAVAGLVNAGYLQVHIQNNRFNYRKPASKMSGLLPLPYHRMLD